MNRIRIQKLQKELLRILNTTLNSKICDDRLSWVSISDINLSPDLSYAKVFFTVLDPEQNSPEKTQAVLTKASSIFKKDIAQANVMRRIPQLTFFFDDTEIKANKIDKILDSLRKNSVD